MSGWNLSATFLAKRGQKIGDSLFAFLAAKDPQTALEVDHEKLTADLRAAATQLAEANRLNEAAQKAAVELQTAVANDTKASATLLAKFEAKEDGVNEAMLNEFAGNLEDMKARLPGLQQDAADAKEYADTWKDIVDTAQKRLQDFDHQAKDAMHNLNQAKADMRRQEMRADQARELEAARSGTGTTSTALGAMNQQANQLRDQAQGMKTVTDVASKPVERAKTIDNIRAIAAGTAAPDSAADRLRRAAAA